MVVRVVMIFRCFKIMIGIRVVCVFLLSEVYVSFLFVI